MKKIFIFELMNLAIYNMEMLFFMCCIAVFIVGVISAMSNRNKIKDVPPLLEKTSESPEDIALYNEDREAYYRKLNAFSEEEIQEILEEEQEIIREYEEMKEKMYGKD